MMDGRVATRSGSLAWAALALIDTPCSADELAQRFAAEGATLRRGRATELLEELVDLGVVRIGEAGESPRYVRTPLGDQMAAGAIVEGGELQAHLAELERLRSELGPGDVAWAGVGCVHEFRNIGDGHVRWLETQAPQPPPRHSYRFTRDWAYLADALAEEAPPADTRPARSTS